MSWPWNVLRLDPETADAASVRRAYVVLVKKHRPDQEPRRFQEIREAYEEAKRILEDPEYEGALPEGPDTDDQEAEETSFPHPDDAPAEPAPPGLLEEFQAALQSKNREALAQILLRARADWERAPRRHPWFQDLVTAAPKLYVETVGDDVAASDAVVAAENDAVDITEAVIPVWVARGAWTCLAALAELLLQRPDGSSSWDQGLPLALVSCSSALALADPLLAQRLADEAHQRLPPEYREGILQDAEVRLRMAAELEELSPADRRKLTRVLARGDDELKGDAFLAVHNAMHAVHRTSLTYELLRRRYPDTARTVRKTRRVVDSYVRKVNRYDRWFGGWRMGVLVALCLFAGRAMLRGLRRTTEWEQTQSTAQDQLEESLRHVDDGMTWTGTGEWDLPQAYAEHRWLWQIRRDIEADWGLHRALAEHTLQGRGTVRRVDPRYPTMLELFRDDDSLPESLRKRCEELLRELSNPPR